MDPKCQDFIVDDGDREGPVPGFYQVNVQTALLGVVIDDCVFTELDCIVIVTCYYQYELIRPLQSPCKLCLRSFIVWLGQFRLDLDNGAVVEFFAGRRLQQPLVFCHHYVRCSDCRTRDVTQWRWCFDECDLQNHGAPTLYPCLTTTRCASADGLEKC